MRTLFKVIISIILILLVSAFGLYKWLTLPPERVENPVITGINYVGMTVSNINKASHLYQQATNLKPSHQSAILNNPVFDQLAGRKGVEVQTQLMTSVNAQLRFMQFKNPSEQAKQLAYVDANGPGIAHVCYQVNQHTKAYDKFLAGGAHHIGAREMIQINPKNPVQYAYARDLDNTMVEIEHVDIEALNLPTPPKNKYRIRHVSLATNNMARAIDFYSTLLETKNPRRAGHLVKIKGEKVDKISGFEQSELEMAWFQVRNLELELIQYYNPAPKTAKPRPIDATGYNMIVFNVTDLAIAKEKLLTAGGSIETEIQPLDDGIGFFGRDLDGNLLGFQKLEDNSPYSAKNFKDNGTS